MKDIMTVIDFTKDKGVEFDACLYALGEKIAIARTYDIDKALIDEMYKAYKDTDVSKVFILDMGQFERFLREMLPKWREENDHV